jgi:hypothetical protein
MAGPPNAVAPSRRNDRNNLPCDGVLRGDRSVVMGMPEGYYVPIVVSRDQIIAEEPV